MPVHVTLTNRGDRAVELSFPSEQRIEILLRDSTGRIVTRWSENRAFAEQVGTLLINPGEHVEYSETIATRELVPGQSVHGRGDDAGLPRARRAAQIDHIVVMEALCSAKRETGDECRFGSHDKRRLASRFAERSVLQ